MTEKARLDRASIAVGATPVEIRDNGWRVYEGTAGFGGIVQDYPELRPPRSEFRPEDEALSEATLASAEGVPVTWDHPNPQETPAGLLIPETAKDHTEGAVLRAWRDGNQFRVKIIVYTTELQRKIEDGSVDLSLGYTQDSDPVEGEFGGKKYQAVQRNIKINHLAVVPKSKSARAILPDGTHARLDDTDTDQSSPAAPYSQNSSKGIAMKKTHMDAALSDEALALVAQMGEGDQALIRSLLDSAKDAKESKMDEDAEEEHEDEEQDAKMIAPLEARLAKLEEMIAGMAGGKDAKMDKYKGRMDSAPTINVEKILQDVENRAQARFDASQKFVEAVRMDGYRAVTVDDAAKVMLETIQEHLPELHGMAVSAAKESRLDSLTGLYKGAERIRKDKLIQEQADVVLGREIPRPTAQDPLFLLPE